MRPVDGRWGPAQIGEFALLVDRDDGVGRQIPDQRQLERIRGHLAFDVGRIVCAIKCAVLL